jgi:AcrR family transcriptional regulator
MARGPRPYHHGNLAAALLDEALQMAAEGGPDAVVLREVARRVGVSATAAYRHFAGQADLTEAVKHAALDRRAEHMRAALAAHDRGDDETVAGQVPLPGIPAGSPQERAARRLEAIGRAYFDFAISQQGLFRCFCLGLPMPGVVQRQDESAFGVLTDVLDDLVAAGLLTGQRRAAGVDVALWSAVHGLAVLCLDGPLADLPREQKYALLTTVTDVLFHGLAGPAG